MVTAPYNPSMKLFCCSSIGDLYEYDRSSKPSWKKHIWREGTTTEDTSLMPSKGCALHGFGGSHSVSLFLLTKVITTFQSLTKRATQFMILLLKRNLVRDTLNIYTSPLKPKKVLHIIFGLLRS